jgi:hypothetical protein
MDREQAARRLLKLAKDLTAGAKVEKTFRQDRDGYEEVSITVKMDVLTMEADDFIKTVQRYVDMIDNERRGVIRKYKVKTDPLQVVRVETQGDDLIISGGFAADIGQIPTEQLKRDGFKQTT